MQALSGGSTDAALALALGAAAVLNANNPASSGGAGSSTGGAPPAGGGGDAGGSPAGGSSSSSGFGVDQKAELRTQLLTLIGDAASVTVPDAAALQATASAVASVVAAPEELTPEAQDRALSLLGGIASQGQLVTPAAATNVAAGLSGVVASLDLAARRRRRMLAEQQPGGAAPPPLPADPRFQQVMRVVDGLADSVRQILAVPGEEGVQITSSSLRVRALRPSSASLSSRTAAAVAAVLSSLHNLRAPLTPSVLLISRSNR